MSRRNWPLRLPCGHEGCREISNYNYSTKRDLMESFELRNFSNGRWRCIRHQKPDEVLSAANPTTKAELIVEQKGDHRYFGHSGFAHGPGFKAFAGDLPPGAKLIITAQLVLPGETA